MSKLINELQRLYFLSEQQWYLSASGDTLCPAQEALTPEIVAGSLAGETAIALNLIGASGLVRAMVIRFSRAADWALVASLYQGLQDDLELPAPSISISGQAGYRLWLSLAEAVPAEQAALFLDGLREKYLADVQLSRFMMLPSGQRLLSLVPSRHEASGKWSAFIDPNMGAMFAEEPGLEMAPGMDRQADLLAGLKSITADEFRQAMEILGPLATINEPLIEPAACWSSSAGRPDLSDAARGRQAQSLGSNYSDPKSFLLAVMNDPSASTEQRIEAARALLPYFGTGSGE